MTLAEELQTAYRLVKEAMAGVKVDNLAEYDMLLAAGFRSAWMSAWQRSRQAREPPTATAAPDAPAPECSTSPGETGSTGSVNLSEVVGLNQGSSSPTSGAVNVVAGLLSTHALTSRQYRKLCVLLNVEPPKQPSAEQVRTELTERKALEVLTA